MTKYLCVLLTGISVGFATGVVENKTEEAVTKQETPKQENTNQENSKQETPEKKDKPAEGDVPSEEQPMTEEQLNAVRSGIDVAQKLLNQKVEKYNKLLRENHNAKKRLESKDAKAASQENQEVVLKGDRVVLVPDNTLEEQEKELKRLNAEIDQEQESLDRRIAAYNKQLENLKGRPLPGINDNAANTDTLRQEIEQLKTLVGELKTQLNDFKNLAFDQLTNPHLTTRANEKDKKALEEILNDKKNDARQMSEALLHYIQNNPESTSIVDAYIHLGEAYNTLGKWDDARSAFESALGNTMIINPQRVDAHLGLAQTEVGKNGREEACKVLLGLSRSNLPRTEAQLKRFQTMIVDYHCSSGMASDITDEQKQKNMPLASLINRS
ncbi:MAG: hypothetical protein Q8K36_02475 [Alphaproteobacteria bacterium]|nr:hypothetical protein [Alphaproteobacteria bacterium]